MGWHDPLFGWGHVLGDVLRALQKGRALSYRPPQWEQRGRDGALFIAAGLDNVLVPGTGASQREHAGLIDATVWVQADHARAEERGIARDIAEGVNGDPGRATAFWHEWMAAELAFFPHEQPWRRACVVVGGTPHGPLDADHGRDRAPLR